MANVARVRYWQPAPEVAAELVGGYLEAGGSPLHVHEEWQFGVVEAPSKLSLGAYRRYGVETEDVTIVRPFDVHSEGGQVGTPPPDWRVLYLGPSIVSRLYHGEIPQLRRPVVTDPAAAATLRELLRLSAQGTLKGTEFLSRVARWLDEFLARHPDDITVSSGGLAVERARAYLQRRPTQAVSLREVGAIAGVTLSHLVRSFSKVVGLPPRSYHAQVRLARARRLLAEGKSATWVAHESGFADQSHLSRRFKSIYGLTPGAFQTQYLARPDGALDFTAA